MRHFLISGRGNGGRQGIHFFWTKYLLCQIPYEPKGKKLGIFLTSDYWCLQPDLASTWSGENKLGSRPGSVSNNCPLQTCLQFDFSVLKLSSFSRTNEFSATSTSTQRLAIPSLLPAAVSHHFPVSDERSQVQNDWQKVILFVSISIIYPFSVV